MRTLIYSIVFIGLIAGAVFVVDSTSNQLDLPYEAGFLKAPDLPQGHGAGHGDGHGGGHGEESHAPAAEAQGSHG